MQLNTTAPPKSNGVNKLVIQDLTILREDRPLIVNLKACLDHGEALHISGPNGAGKTTLLLAIAGLVPCLNGSILFKGRRLETKQLTLIEATPPIKNTLTVEEHLLFWGALQGVSPDTEKILNTAGLFSLRRQKGETLSFGQKQKLSLSRLLFSETPVWLLDEPLLGLDRDAQNYFILKLKSHCAQGGIIIFSSHQTLNAFPSKMLSLKPSFEKERIG